MLKVKSYKQIGQEERKGYCIVNEDDEIKIEGFTSRKEAIRELGFLIAYAKMED